MSRGTRKDALTDSSPTSSDESQTPVADLPHVERELGGWGRFPRATCHIYRPGRMTAIPTTITKAATASILPRGAGRSYGDASLNGGSGVVDLCAVDRLIDLDDDAGVLRAEAGVTVAQALAATVPRGWFLPVVPGTCFPTLGGLFAADVHGKNHHGRGSFQEHAPSITMHLASGERVTCSRDERADLFAATAGGMGLTGVITDIEVKLRNIESTAIRVHEKCSANLAETMAILEQGDHRHEHSVAWVDGLADGKSLGRGTVLFGDHAARHELDGGWRDDPLRMPVMKERGLPGFLSILLGRSSMKLFNAVRYSRSKARSRKSHYFLPYDDFFFPLDSLRDWNRLYGSDGFVQYQCVVPFEGAERTLSAILEHLQRTGHPSYLVVLKRFGQGHGMLSFPQPGWTIACDMPVRRGLLETLSVLDAELVSCGGRVYLAKDARLDRGDFREMYPEVEGFLAVKREVDPEDRFSSDLARRLGLVAKDGGRGA